MRSEWIAAIALAVLMFALAHSSHAAGTYTHTTLQGGLPLEVDGKVVGAIGVSGAANQSRDEAVAKAGAAALE